MLEPVLFSIAFVILVIGTYTDIKKREVPDWVNFSGIVAGIGLRTLWSLNTQDWSILGWGLLGFGAFFSLAILMYYTGQWGGGDSKLLMAIGALVGLEFSLDSMAVVFVIWALLAGAAYGLVWSIFLAIKTWSSFTKCYSVLAKNFRWAHVPVWAVFVFGVGFAIASDDELFRILMLVIALVIPVLFYTALGVKAVELCCMHKRVKPSKLTEGDWIAKPVFVNRKYIAGPKDLGISKEKINLLKRLKVKDVIVKEGIPFVPSFLIAFLLSLWLGNPLHWFL